MPTIDDRLIGLTGTARVAAKSDAVLAVLPDIVASKNVVRGNLGITFLRPPGLITNNLGEVVGYDVMVAATLDGKPLAIDPHRVCINPPFKVVTGLDVDGKPVREENPREAFLGWLEQSIRDNP